MQSLPSAPCDFLPGAGWGLIKCGHEERLWSRAGLGSQGVPGARKRSRAWSPVLEPEETEKEISSAGSLPQLWPAATMGPRQLNARNSRCPPWATGTQILKGLAASRGISKKPG